MSLGGAVDFCIEYNNRQERAEKQAQHDAERGHKRKATQRDIDAFFG